MSYVQRMGDERVLVGKVVRYGEIGNAVCWNYKIEVVIRFAVVIPSKSNQGYD